MDRWMRQFIWDEYAEDRVTVYVLASSMDFDDEQGTKVFEALVGPLGRRAALTRGGGTHRHLAGQLLNMGFAAFDYKIMGMDSEPALPKTRRQMRCPCGRPKRSW